MTFTESGILLRNYLVVIYSHILHHSLIPTIYENFKLVAYLSKANKNLELPCLFESSDVIIVIKKS